MKSPRFDIRAAALQKIFTASNLQQIWSAKVRVTMRDQYLLDAIEHFDFTANSSTACEKLAKRILEGDYVPAPAQRILVEKSKGLCRQVVVPAPEDALVLQCLSDSLYMQLKGKEPTKKAFYQPKDHTFSQGPKGYGTFASWLNFQKAIFGFSQTRPFVVVTDIANYYDSISYSHLRNIIASISDVEESVLDMLIYVLSELLWQPDYMPRIEVGLPQIDLDAPRLLAHCFLYELDSYLASTPTGDFGRFMDDIDVGVDSIPEAKRVLQSIDLVLQTRQVRLNSGKTLILNQSEAIRHFCIFENAALDNLTNTVRAKAKAGQPLTAEQHDIRKRISRGLRKGRFDRGNGDKILKRLLNLAGETGTKLNLRHLAAIARLRPVMREHVYKYLSQSPLTESRARMLSDLVDSGLFIDHASYTDLINFLTTTIIPNRSGIQKHLDHIVEAIKNDGYFGFHAAVIGQSRFGDSTALLGFLGEMLKSWQADYRLGRLVGGLAPLFFGTSNWDEYVDLIVRSRNEGARDVFKFHSALRTTAASLSAMKPFLVAQNTSKATRTTHAKFLTTLSALKNPNLHPSLRIKIMKANGPAWTDGHYRRLGRKLLGLKSFP